MHPTRPNTPRRVARPLALLLPIGFGVAGCHTWRAEARPVTQVVRDQRPRELRLRRTDGSTVTLRDARVVEDTARVYGTGTDSVGASDTLIAGALVARTLAGGEIARGGGRRNAVVLVRQSEISGVEVRERSRSRTWAAVGAGVAFVALVVLLGPTGSGPGN